MEKLITLDANVLQALDFFIANPPVKFNPQSFQLPFVVGSGNAYNTGLILFSDTAAIFADESSFKKLIIAFKPAITQGLIKDVVVISASGEKDSVWEVEVAKQMGLKTALLTTKADSSAAKIADTVFTFKSIAEPYTYNVSTYMGMMMAASGENPAEIKSFIGNLKLPANFSQYEGYAFVLPDKFVSICPMLDIKKSELFGSNLSLRAFSQGHARHAKFVIKNPKELVITLDSVNEYFGVPQSRLDITLPDNFGPAAVMAITYYIVGKIQSSKTPYYMENIQNYVTDYGPKAYSPTTKPFDLIVPGSQ